MESDPDHLLLKNVNRLLYNLLKKLVFVGLFLNLNFLHLDEYYLPGSLLSRSCNDPRAPDDTNDDCDDEVIDADFVL